MIILANVVAIATTCVMISSFHLKGGANTKDARELIFARQSLVTHAKAFGLDAIDLVDTNFKGMSIPGSTK